MTINCWGAVDTKLILIFCTDRNPWWLEEKWPNLSFPGSRPPNKKRNQRHQDLHILHLWIPWPVPTMTLCRWCLRSCHPSVALEERPNWGLLPKDPKVLLGMLNTLLNKKWNSNDSFDSNWSWSNVEFQLLTCDYHWWIQQVLCSFGPWTSRIFKLPDLRHFPMTWTAGQIVQRLHKINAPKVPCLSSSLLTKVELFQLGRLLSHAVESLCPYHPLFIVGAMETHLRCWRLLASYFFSIKTLTTARQGRSGGLDGFWTKLVHSEGPNSIETVQWITCYCLPFNDKKRINKHEIHVSLINDSWKQQWLKALFDYTSPTLGVNIYFTLPPKALFLLSQTCAGDLLPGELCWECGGI